MDIDFVVTWLDSTDVKWQEEYNKYKGLVTVGDQSKARYRDWDVFKYWFRAVEQYAPWVHKVFLITNGTFPKWINEHHPKLVLVKHEDYIPSAYLPTFNSHTIELNFNRIKGLSEHFVYFNDDMYLNNPVTPDYYFRDGLPCDENAESIYNVCCYNPVSKFNIKIINFTNICVLNGHFNRAKVVKQSFKRWHGLHLGLIDRMMNLIISLDPHKRFIGFRERHSEQPYLKSTLDDAWKHESGMLTNSCTRFREDTNISPYFFRYWQFALNKFYPVKLDKDRKLRLIPEEFGLVKKTFEDPRINSVCLNDTALCTDEQYEALKPQLLVAFEEKFPQKSSYEI